jgi:hypothetical protein
MADGLCSSEIVLFWKRMSIRIGRGKEPSGLTIKFEELNEGEKGA